MIVPPIPLFTVHGKPDGNQLTWSRHRIIFFDDEGVPWIVGNEPWKHEDEFHPGDKRLRPAAAYSDFLGIAEADSRELDRVTIPAAPGWQCLFGYKYIDDNNKEGIDTELQQIAAWCVDPSGYLVPVVGECNAYAGQYDSMVTADKKEDSSMRIIMILQPGDDTPNAEKRMELARQAFPTTTP